MNDLRKIQELKNYFTTPSQTGLPLYFFLLNMNKGMCVE